VSAEVHARTVRVLGLVVGNITATDRVEVASTGTVRGDISAPRVVLAEGSTFQGSINQVASPAARFAARG
jgi:cytoskeletal protein CcmA (bactofilin family)